MNLTQTSHLRQPKAPARHQRTYEAHGQRWPTNLTKHLRLADLPEPAFTAALEAKREGRAAA